MSITLESLEFIVQTSSLDVALKKVEELTKQVQGLATQLDTLGTSSKDAAKNEVELVKIKERLIKAQAKLEETQQKLSKSSEELATAQDKQRKSLPQEDELNRVQKILEREATVLKILTGQTIELADGNVTLSKTFSAGQASKLATLKLAGALSSEFNALAGSITQINSISQVNPFDKTAGSLEKMRKEVAELTKVNEYAARGFNLTKDQIVGLTRDIQSVTIASKQAGESADQLQQRIAKLELSTVAEANALNMLKQAAKDSELAAKAHAKAEIERATAIARASQEADKQAANRRSMVGAGREEQYKSEMDLLRSQYQAEEKLQLERQSMLKDSFSKEIQIKQWKSQQDQANYQADMKAFKDYYGALEAEAMQAEQHLAAITSRINKEVARTKFLNTGASRSTANIAAGMEVKGVPQDVINSFVKEATAKEQAARASREMAAANEFLRETEQRLAASLDMSNAAMNRASTDELVKIKSALDKSGLSADAAAIKFKGLEEKLREVSSKDKARDLQHLARAMSVQLGDVGVSLAGGMNPLLVMIQQGDQIRGVIQQVGADAQQMNGVMKTALGQIVSSFAMVGQAVGSFFVGSIQSAGKAVTDLAMQLTLTGPLFEQLRNYVASTTGETSKATKAIDMLGSVIRTTTGLIVSGLVVAYSTAAVAAYKLMQAQTDLNNAVIQNSAVWGLTKDEIVAASEAMVTSGTTSLRMLGIFTELAKTGKVTKDALSEVATAARDLSINGGRSVADISSLMSKVYDDPVKGLSAYRTATGLVTQSEMERVEQLVRIGNETAAITEAQKIMASSLKQESANMISDMSPIETLWKDIKNVIADVWQGIQEFAQSDRFLGPLKTALQAIGITAYEVYYAITGLGSSLGGLAAQAGAIASGEWDQVLKIDNEINKNNIQREQDREKFVNKMMNLGNKEIKAEQDNAKIRATISADNANQEKARRKILDEIDKYEDKPKNKMKGAGSRSAYIKAELDDVLKTYQGMTEKEQELFKKMRGEQYDAANKQKKGKTDSEKEANRLMKAYAKDIEAINGITADAISYQENYSKAQQKVLDIMSNPNFAKYSEEKRKTLAVMAEEAIRQADIAEGQKLANKLLGQSNRLSAQYYEDLRRIQALYQSGGLSAEDFELAKKRLFDATEQGRAYISALREMLNKTRELADARTTLNIERDATLAGSVTESDEIKRQGEINKEKLRIEREYQLELQKIKDTYIGDDKKTLDAKADLTKRNEEIKKAALENLGIKNATQELGSFSLEFKLLIERTNEFGVSLEGAFGGFGKNISTAISAFTKLGATLEQNGRLLKAAQDKPEQYAKLQKKLAKDEILLYAQTAGAAKSMFGEKTAAAKAFGAIEKTLHIVRLGMLAVEMAENIKSVGIALATDGAKKASALGAMVVDGTAAVVSALKGPFPMNLAAAAAVAAVVAGLIGSVGGSFNGKVSGSAPKYNEGTGTVFGDSKAKSESINNSAALLEKANSLTQKYSPQMLLHLRNIDSSIGGLVNLMIRAGGIQGKAPVANVGSKQNYEALTNLTTALTFGLSGFVFKPLGNLIGSLFGKTKTTNLGSGITGGKQSLSDILGSGFNASYFTDVQIKKSGLFGSSTKYKTYMSEADAELEQQITAVFEGMYNSILLGAKALGGSQNEIVKQLDNFVVDIGKVKLTGTAQEMQETLTAVFGAAGDNIAKAVMPGLEQFQKVGEGYLETLIRTATELENVNSWFDMLGKSMLQLGISGVKASQSLIDLFGGVSNFETAVSDYYDNFYSEQEKIDTKVKQLTSAFTSLGLELPKSIQGYRDIVNTQDITTQSGQETFYSLVSLSSAFKDVIDYSNQASEEIVKSVEEYLAALQNQVRSNEDIANSIYGYMQNTSKLKAEYSDLISGATGVNSAVYKLTTEGMHPLEKAAYEEFTAVESLISIQKQKISLENRLSSLTKTSSAIREQELLALYESNRALQEHIWLIEDSKKAYEDSKKATDDALNKIKEVSQKQIEVLQKTFSVTDSAYDKLEESVNVEKKLIEDVAAEKIRLLQEENKVTTEAYQKQIDVAGELASSLKSIFNLLLSSVSELRGEVAVTAIMQSAQGRGVIKSAISSGVIPSSDIMEQAVGAARSGVEGGTYASLADRNRQYLLLSNELEALKNVTGNSLTESQKTLKILENTLTFNEKSLDKQVSAIETARDNQILSLNAILESAKLQIDVLRNVDVTSLTISEATSKLETAAQSERLARATILSIEKQVTLAQAQYNAIRGVQEGVTTTTEAVYLMQLAIVNELSRLSSYNIVSNKVPAFAEGGYHSGGIRLVGENGPELEVTGPAKYFNSSMTAKMLSGSDSNKIVSELRQLREEVTLLRAEARATAVHTSKIAKLQDRSNELDTVKVTIVADQTI